MSQPPAIAIAVLIFAVVFALVVALAYRMDPPHRGRHTPFADPADRDDPWGETYIARLRDEARMQHEKRSPDLAALTRGPGGTGWLPMLPDDPPPDETAVLPVAVCELGMTAGEYVDQLFPTEADVDLLFAKYEKVNP